LSSGDSAASLLSPPSITLRESATSCDFHITITTIIVDERLNVRDGPGPLTGVHVCPVLPIGGGTIALYPPIDGRVPYPEAVGVDISVSWLSHYCLQRACSTGTKDSPFAVFFQYVRWLFSWNRSIHRPRRRTPQAAAAARRSPLLPSLPHGRAGCDPKEGRGRM